MVIGIVVIVFFGLFAGFEFTLKVISQSQAKMTALSLATDRVEYIRSLPYASVGTVSGIPSGSIPQNRTVTLNNITFNERVLVEYVDDPADGLVGADSNGVVADYKRFKVEYTWDVYGSTQQISLISSVSPVAIETNNGGGTVRITVIDAESQPLSNADVRLINNTGTSSIDITRNTDSTGTALFSGAPAQAGYETIVTAPGYSTDQTYQAIAPLINPATPPFALAEAGQSSLTFIIDRLSDLEVQVFDSEVVVDDSDGFDDALGIFSNSDIVATSSELTLLDMAGIYSLSGDVLLMPIEPTTIAGWGVAHIDKTLPLGTDVRVRFYSSTSPAYLISDSNLPGNSTGFSTEYIDLSSLEVSTYPTLVAGITLSTVDSSVTPVVHEFTISYVESRSGVSGLTLNMNGLKNIGTNASASNIPKLQVSTTTNGSGKVFFNDIEWDTYNISLGSGYTVTEACSGLPYYLSPNKDDRLYLRAMLASANNLRVVVKDSAGNSVIGANVEIDNGSVTSSDQTGWCGQVFMNSLSSADSYDIEVTAPGFSTFNATGILVAGDTVYEVTLTP